MLSTIIIIIIIIIILIIIIIIIIRSHLGSSHFGSVCRRNGAGAASLGPRKFSIDR